jgi:hypothetical protein
MGPPFPTTRSLKCRSYRGGVAPGLALVPAPEPLPKCPLLQVSEIIFTLVTLNVLLERALAAVDVSDMPEGIRLS